MNLAATLARIEPITPGQFTFVVVKPAQGKVFTRHFPADTGHLSAEALIQRESAKGNDTYFAVNAFTKPRRVQEYLGGSRALYIDADVARPGDGKDPAKVFPDRVAAWAWLKQFCRGTGMPYPNVTIDSGYGYHWYWVLDTVLNLGKWQPLADALKNAMVAYGWVADTNSTIDSARILRPPGVLNHKVPSAPVPTALVTLPSLPTADHSYIRIENILQTCTGLVNAQHVGTPATRVTGVSRTISPSPAVILGPPPAHVTPGVGPGLNAAAHANLGQLHEPSWFGNISQRCLQAEQSLANAGAGDPYPLWYLGWMTLLGFCEDGDQFIHQISSGHTKYNTANVDAHFARTIGEITIKGIGPPTCAKIDAARPGVCGGCPFNGKVVSPIKLGYPVDPVADLPDLWRRNNGHIEALVGHGKTQRWVKMLPGDMSKPWLEELPIGGYRIHLEYTVGGKTTQINATNVDLGAGGVAVARSLSQMGIAASKNMFELIGEFLVAWIQKLRDQRVMRHDGLRPFGWTTDEHGKHLGFAVAGRHYFADGREEDINAGDPGIAAAYRPMGILSEWQKPGPLFTNSEPAAHLIIATAFAAPLLSIASVVKGITWNFWSNQSGVRKTAAMEYAQSVWGYPGQKSSQQDTYNAVVNLLGTTRVLPRYWDDMRCDDKDAQETFNALVHSITQGAEKNRLNASAQLQRRHEWQTMLVISSNRSLSDLLSNNDTTDSGYQRLIQVKFERQATPHNAQVGMVLNLINTNYGQAGRIYAKHIAMNHDVLQQEIVQAMDVLGKRFTIQQAERHFVTAWACVLVGALHAQKLGLFTFDLTGMMNCMQLALNELRNATGSQVLISNTGAFDHEEVLVRYVQHEADRRVRTDIFGAPGTRRPEIYAPPRVNGVTVQIAQTPQIIRVNRSEFGKWLSANNIAKNQFFGQLRQLPNVIECRAAIAASTQWASTGHPWVFDIPLVGALVSFLDPIVQHPIQGLDHLQQVQINAPITP